jgi:hypothetical protein
MTSTFGGYNLADIHCTVWYNEIYYISTHTNNIHFMRSLEFIFFHYFFYICLDICSRIFASISPSILTLYKNISRRHDPLLYFNILILPIMNYKRGGRGSAPPSQHEILTRGLSPPEPLFLPSTTPPDKFGSGKF